MAAVLLKDVIKRYGKSEIIHGVNLEIGDGDFVVLVGPSGCGKSTTLRMIAGLEEISGGEVRIGRRVVNDISPRDRNVAMVFQNYALYPHMNVFDNIAFGLKIRKTPPSEIETRVLDAARILHIEELLQRKPSELSGGQRQRVAMGRAIVRNPSVFLFDEPLSNLDAKLRTRMRIEIKRLHLRLKSTIIYVTHDQVEAMTLGDRIVVMRDGEIEQMGGPMELFQHPVNTFVAGFIGSPPMNLIDAEIVDDEGLTLQFPDGLRLPIPKKPGAGIRAGQKVVMGLRTKDLILDDDGARFPGEWKARGVVEVVEPLGGEAYIHANLQGVKAVAQCEGRRSVHVGDSIHFAFNLEHLHIFDAATRESIY